MYPLTPIHILDNASQFVLLHALTYLLTLCVVQPYEIIHLSLGHLLHLINYSTFHAFEHTRLSISAFFQINQRWCCLGILRPFLYLSDYFSMSQCQIHDLLTVDLKHLSFVLKPLYYLSNLLYLLNEFELMTSSHSPPHSFSLVFGNAYLSTFSFPSSTHLVFCDLTKMLCPEFLNLLNLL